MYNAKHLTPTMAAILLSLSAALSSCVNEAYNVENIDTEITVAQDGLALPLGSTKKIQVSELVSKLGTDMISVLDGSYAIRQNGELNLTDELPDLSEMLTLDDIKYTEAVSFKIEGLGSDDISTAPLDYTDEISVGSISEPDIQVPSIQQNRNINMQLAEYAGKIKGIQLGQNLTQTDITTNVAVNLPTIPSAVTGEVNLDDFVTIDQTISELTQNMTVSMDSPSEDVSKVYDIKLQNSSKLLITTSISGDEFISSGDIVTDLKIDLGDLFSIKGATGSEISISQVLTKGNLNATKEVAISGLNIKASDWNAGHLSRVNTIKVNGSIKVQNAKTTANLVNSYQGNGLTVNIAVSFAGMAVESALMDLNEISVSENIEVPVSLGDGFTLPEGVNAIKNVKFTDNSALSLSLGLKNVNDPNIKVNVNNLEMSFPSAMSVEGPVQFAGIDLKSGFSQKFMIGGISLPAPQNGAVKWDDKIVIAADVKVGGTGIDSAKLPVSADKDCQITASAVSNLSIADWTASIDDMNMAFTGIGQEFSQDIDGSLAEYGTFTVTPQGTPKFRMVIGMPQTGLDIVPGNEGVKISFPDFIRFKNVPSIYNYDTESNSIKFTSSVPENISLEIGKLVIAPQKKADGSGYEVKGSFSVEGGVMVKGGDISKADLAGLNGSKLAITASVPAITAGRVAIDEFKMEMEKDLDITIIQAGSLPAEIVGIEEATLDDAELGLGLKLTGIPDLGYNKEIGLDVALTLPEVLVLGADDRVKDNVLTIKGTLDKYGTIAIAPLTIKGINLKGKDITKGVVDKIGVNAKISVDNPDINLSTLNADITANVTAKLTGLEFSKVSGNVKYTINESTQTVSLKDVPDILKGDNVNLDLYNPYVLINANTNIGIPIDAKLSIVPVREGVEYAKEAVELELNIEGAESAQKAQDLKYYIAVKDEGRPADYKFIGVPGIKNLLAKIPDELKIKVNAATNSSKLSTIESSAKYVFDINYDFVCPIAFDDKLHLEFETNVTGVNETISKVIKGATVQLGGSIENTLPVQLQLDIRALDAEGKELPLETPAVQTISCCNADGSPSKSDLNLTLKMAKGASAAAIDQFRLIFTVTSGNVTGIALKEDAYVQAVLKLRLPEGVTVDIKDFQN